MRPQSWSALSILSSLRENSHKALTAKIMTRFELLYRHITGLFISKHVRMANIQPQLKDLGIWEWLIKAGESLEPARIPGFWLAKNLTELWLAEIRNYIKNQFFKQILLHLLLPYLNCRILFQLGTEATRNKCTDCIKLNLILWILFR